MIPNTHIKPDNVNTSSDKHVGFDEGGVSLLVGPDTIVGTVDPPAYEESWAQGDDFISQEIGTEIVFAAPTIRGNAEIANLLGFEATDNTIASPSNSRLNSLRSGLIESTGIHSGTFVEHHGGFIEIMDFVGYLSRREIPMAVEEPYHTAHDNLFHRLGYATMSEAVFSRFVTWATKAVEKDDEALAKIIVTTIDEITSRGPTLGVDGRGGDQFLGSFYREFMPPIVAGMRAFSDTVTQRRTIRKLKSVARSQTK
jgi:hypothetical protein